MNRLLVLALALVALTTAACATPAPTPTGPGPGYLQEEIPPCTPAAGSNVEPCEQSLAPRVRSGVGIGSIDLGPENLDIRRQLTRSRVLHGHIIVRGTYLPDTVRCVYYPPEKLPPQAAQYERGGPPTIKCYADVRVNEYVVGTGPSVLTVIAEVFSYLYYYDRGGYYTFPPDKENETEHEYIERIRLDEHQQIDGGDRNIVGREAMLFLGPSVDINVEAWEVMRQWWLERRDNGTVIAVHPARDIWRKYSSDDFEQHRPQMELEIPAFRQAVTTAHQARMTANGGRTRPNPTYPKLVSDATQLSAYFREVGAYDDPDDPPAQPPLRDGLLP